MTSDFLPATWQIFIVVLPQYLPRLQHTLDDVAEKSLGNNVALLGVDAPEVRARLSGLAMEVHYPFPEAPAGDRFWSALLEGQCIGPEPTLVLLGGTRVPEHWDARLVAAGRRLPDAAAIAPLCTSHPVLGVLSGGAAPGLGVDEIDQWLNDYVGGKTYPVPVMLPSCMLLQGEFWREPPGTDNDHALVETMRCRGLSPLATEQVYVDDFAVAAPVDIDYLPQPTIDAWVARSPFAGLRHAIGQLSARGEPPPQLRHCLPVQLHVGHSWGGGLDRWIRDFVHADRRHNHLVLRSIGDLNAFGQTIALYRSTEMGAPLRTWTLADPILSVSPGTMEYRGLLEEILREFGVETVVVSSFIGHSLDLLRMPLPVTVVLHEFFPFCPALYAYFDDPCTSCSRDRLRACFDSNPHHAIFRLESDAHWIGVRRQFATLAAADSVTMVAPSHALVRRYRELEQALRNRPIEVIPHGLTRELAESLVAVRGAPGAGGSPARLVMLGRLTREKGAELLAAALHGLLEFAQVWLLGTGESGARFASVRGVTVVREYRSAELAGLLQDIRPDIGMILSTVPESFSYTLSELRAAGIPVVATRVGALEERINEGEDGWLISPDPSQLIAKVRHIVEHRAALEIVSSNLRQAPVRSVEQMLLDYQALEPRAPGIPTARYHLPRRSYCNPYAPIGGSGAAALHVNPQRPYRQALAEFLLFTARKMEQTPSLPRTLGRLGAALLQRAAARCAP